MNLRELVEMYRRRAGDFGRAVALDEFGMTREETQRVFSALDEDYHISRFLHFTLDPGCEGDAERVFLLNGIAQSHVAIEQGILEIL